LAENNLVSKIRVADKVLPSFAGLTKKQEEIFASNLVEFKQTPLTQEPKIAALFDESEGKWDYVFNLAGETKYSQTEAVYKENVIDVAIKCATAASKHAVKRFIEVSTAQVYDAGKKPSKEGDKLEPWTNLAKAKLEAEKAISSIPNLNYVILRPAIVYGPGDISGITPRIICGAVYKHIGEDMKFLWDKEMKVNTVHVNDVCRALWHLTSHGDKGAIFNLADENDTDQQAIGALLSEIFGIKTSCMGSTQTNLAKAALSMKRVAEGANEKHLTPWSELCKAKGITNTVLSPYVDEELLYHNSLSIDGSAIKTTGFEYKHPKVTKEALLEVIKHFQDLGYFPKNY
jgi:nucleoside-diphosphate-sugar epimerase